MAVGSAVRRVASGAVDIGAFELGNSGTPVPEPRPVPTTPPPPDPPPPPNPPPPPGSSPLTLLPVEDTYIRGGSYATTNYGTSNVLHVKSDSDLNLTRDAYLRFDLGTLASVSSAKLRVYARLTSTDRVTSVLYPVTAAWSESGLTWSSRPGYVSSRPLGSMTPTTTFTWYEFDVTSHVVGERQAGRRLVAFALHCPAPSVERIDVNSREAASNRPELVLAP
jgi:hypothetical protein